MYESPIYIAHTFKFYMLNNELFSGQAKYEYT